MTNDSDDSDTMVMIVMVIIRVESGLHDPNDVDDLCRFLMDQAV